uniref:NAD-dependent epimerase/dehydratase domain-containing protein n=1 Tax=Calcidiscus leptoporus TaxID=127549 RepID=A0A7S0IXH7_9EUKA|mmetsp:Transcript_27165/g.63437  ORF Transcript_27165/g.63437 Transcript_27165/m.63437 type:complete len:337 (+) Transcript_27165:49-1059(+)
MSVAIRPGGRSSNAGITATVFGASGFLGKYVVSRLGAVGVRVIVPYRGDELYLRHLKPMGDLGVVNFKKTSIRNLEDIEAAVDESNVVINLLGRQTETRRWSFNDINVSFPSVLAEVCAEKGVDRLIHVSALAAALDSPSAWARSKAVGEAALKEAFPSATILRPATLFGDEDKFLNRMAIISRHVPFFPLSNGGIAKQQPVHVDNVARAVFNALADPSTAGQTYSLAGPKVYTMKEITDFMYKSIDDSNNAVSVPQALSLAIGFAVEQLPGPWLSADEVRLQATDVVLPEGGAPGLEELGIAPSPMEEIAEHYLFMYKKSCPFIDNGRVYTPPPQ